MRTVTKEWWLKQKPNYIFDPTWFEAFHDIDPRLGIPAPLPDGSPQLGKLGIVFWHEPDGKTIIPVGVIFKEGEDCIFCYHPDYVNDPHTKAISAVLPKRTEPFICNNDRQVLFYFDNLVSDGWLGMMQYNACHVRDGHQVSDLEKFDLEDTGDERYKRLLMFGRGFHGAVSVVDAVAPDAILSEEEATVHRSTHSQATIGGKQPKMLAIKDRYGKFQPADRDDVSTHIVKFQNKAMPGIVENEYLNIVATRALMPHDVVMEAEIGKLEDSDETALFIKRFDRTPEGGRLHFEEALQIANMPAALRYKPSYKELADIARRLTGKEGAEQLFRRVLGQFLLGNTDGHFKNFAFWKVKDHWELTPNYDLVSTENFLDETGRPMNALALPLGGRQLHLENMNPYNVVLLGAEFGLDTDTVTNIAKEIIEQIPQAKQAVMTDTCPYVDAEQREAFCLQIDRRARLMLAEFEERCKRPNGRANGKHSWEL